MDRLVPNRFQNVLLHLRAVLATLASGFLVAVPAQLLLRGKEVAILQSLAWGVVFLIASFILVPLSPFDWEKVRLPRFMRYDRTVSFWATLGATFLFLLSLLSEPLGRNRSVFWFVLVIAFFGLARHWANAFIFPGYYRKNGGRSDPPPTTRIDEGTRVIGI